ncbi:ABC transporter permease subunit [Modestobacter sp. I12A-02628]|uniref:ABC transporter permease n=1 Tax=Goekera deserti TaxID=2497753 RepID=A0A7K3WJ22_9ACTN|nr:ABC transporter permease [Goekera deserti]MPQ98168.1 ABC transporter permease subunit [Goekera deserti]NDI48817.1 ABC transporter permease subunit [Goekera deserti]NEL56498.1 ABC transporter permease [Goekera deserti]
MNAFRDAFVYLNDPLNWSRPNGILDLLGDHLRISLLAMAVALLIAVPLAAVLGHRGTGGGFTVGLVNISRAVPTLAILAIFAVTSIGFTIWAPVIALAIFAVPPILANTYVGFRGVDRDVVEAARAMGMSGRQIVFRVELPLATPMMLTGIRTSAVQVVATATLAALLGGGTLGQVIRIGFARQDNGIIIAGALLVAGLAMATELLLSVVGWLVTPGARELPFRRAASVRPVGEDVVTSGSVQVSGLRV